VKASQGAAYARIMGVGGYRPRRLVPNDEIVGLIDSSDEWIRTRSGIASRGWAQDDETVRMMSVEAGRAAISAAGLEAQQVDCVIVATVSHFRQTPAIATSIATDLGCEQPAAFDISAACAGFCTALAMASDLVRGGSAHHVLVIGVERLSDLTDVHDRGTAFIFADGAGAAVVGPSETPAIGPVVWGSDGERSELIQQGVDWLEALPTGDTPWLRMEGNAVFRWASYAMAKVAQEALDAAGVAAEELDLFVPHQANMRITDAMAKAMHLPEHVRIARDIATSGNTSAASIPLALSRMIQEGQARSGDLALFIAFGAGLVYAAQVVRIP
jgi:3-oxoacyl-[acyl-carrier-protein] synthase III